MLFKKTKWFYGYISGVENFFYYKKIYTSSGSTKERFYDFTTDKYMLPEKSTNYKYEWDTLASSGCMVDVYTVLGKMISNNVVEAAELLIELVEFFCE